MILSAVVRHFVNLISKLPSNVQISIGLNEIYFCQDSIKPYTILWFGIRILFNVKYVIMKNHAFIWDATILKIIFSKKIPKI